MPDVAPFADFYRAVNGDRDPFPWQARLADLVTTSSWPRVVGVPTGLGKTACLDIAVWALAHSAGPGFQRAPTRTWYVVDRRLLVDAAWEHGRKLASLLADPGGLPRSAQEPVASVAAALNSIAAIGVDRAPLYVARLRGGADLGARVPDPSQPALILATVPMFASRWLFRGYGSSTSMRPIDAALAGVDSLVLMDEAHLARGLRQLVTRTAQCDIGNPSTVIAGPRARPVFVSLTATGDADEAQFDLDDADLANPVVATRIKARRPTTLVDTTSARLADTLADRALASLEDRNDTCVVFVNAPATARLVADRVRTMAAKSAEGPDLWLITGRMRDREGDRIRARLLDPRTGVAAGEHFDRDRPLVVVATQTLEVGADVDFNHLVTETAGVRSLVQRLGRVNRLGTRSSTSCAVCHPGDRTTWPVYGPEPAQVWKSLTAAAQAGPLDLSPATVGGLLGPPQDRVERFGELLPAHLWEWAKTTNPPTGEAPVELFFEGFDGGGDVSMVWRAHLPADGVRLAPTIRAGESVDLPLRDVRENLGERRVRRLAPDRASLITTDAGDLRPGDVVALTPEDGLYDEFGWNPTATEPVLDVSLLLSGTLPLTEDALQNLAPGCLDRPEVRDALHALLTPPEDEQSDDTTQVAALSAALRTCAPHPWMEEAEWKGFLDRLGTVIARPIDDVPVIVPAPTGPRWATVQVRADAFEELSFTAASPLLVQHLGAVGETAARIAEALGISDPLVKAVYQAGLWHDLGKLDPRFQRWLDPDVQAAAPLAKSSLAPDRIQPARSSSGWPQGGRHELLSARLVAAWLRSHPVDFDADLVLHLIASHHGYSRPLTPPVEDPAPFHVRADIEGQEVAASGDLGTTDWEQPRRFRAVCERYGIWGTALLEAIVRQADHLVSHIAEVA